VRRYRYEVTEMHALIADVRWMKETFPAYAGHPEASRLCANGSSKKPRPTLAFNTDRVRRASFGAHRHGRLT
jgi:hypothetical protein